ARRLPPDRLDRAGGPLRLRAGRDRQPLTAPGAWVVGRGGPRDRAGGVPAAAGAAYPRSSLMTEVSGVIRTALVVDDEPQIRALLAAYLARDGFVVREAGTGAEALRQAGLEPLPDVVLLDVGLP